MPPTYHRLRPARAQSGQTGRAPILNTKNARDPCGSRAPRAKRARNILLKCNGMRKRRQGESSPRWLPSFGIFFIFPPRRAASASKVRERVGLLSYAPSTRIIFVTEAL